MEASGGELAALFGGSFLAATLLPIGSELLLAALAVGGEWSKWLLLGVATLGNTLGGMTSWAIGRLVPMPARLSDNQRLALERVRKAGPPILLLSWVPLIGDPLCVAAGWLRVGWPLACAYMLIGKVARYGAILYFL
ncbi:MAG: DedA family protein [Chromatiales bacterium]|nr:DedA family protein [Chromatiales bacterium]